MNKNYGYGIVDRYGRPWWNESCVCQDRAPLDEVVENMNDPAMPMPESPFRVVRLFWIKRKKK